MLHVSLVMAILILISLVHLIVNAYLSITGVWGEELDKQERHKDLFNCYEQALETFPDNEEVLNNLGSHLYRLES